MIETAHLFVNDYFGAVSNSYHVFPVGFGAVVVCRNRKLITLGWLHWHQCWKGGREVRDAPNPLHR